MVWFIQSLVKLHEIPLKVFEVDLRQVLAHLPQLLPNPLFGFRHLSGRVDTGLGARIRLSFNFLQRIIHFCLQLLNVFVDVGKAILQIAQLQWSVVQSSSNFCCVENSVPILIRDINRMAHASCLLDGVFSSVLGQSCGFIRLLAYAMRSFDHGRQSLWLDTEDVGGVVRCATQKIHQLLLLGLHRRRWCEFWIHRLVRWIINPLKRFYVFFAFATFPFVDERCQDGVCLVL
mmetsp:Transcript_20690/g.39331  ORF Transcript_20690/g.39331 Transcript_20690/m.39331 type:complete len:232 (-) Transcript_20690:176-871(-)